MTIWHLWCSTVLTLTDDAYNSFTDLPTQTSLDAISNGSLTNCTGIPDRVIHDIRFYSLGVIIPAGLFGNIISIVVFLSSQLRRKSPGQYFLALALADNIVLLGELCLWLNKSSLEGRDIKINFMRDDIFSCKFVNYLRYLGRIWSSLIVMTISVERLIMICLPLKAERYSTPNCARVIITLLFIFGALVSSPIFTYVGISTYKEKQFCYIVEEYRDDFLVWCLSGVVAFEMIVPGIVIFIVTGLIIYRLTITNSMRMMMQATGVFKERRSERQTNMTLIAAALSFLLLRPPYIISYCIYLKGVLWQKQACDPLFDFQSFAAYGISYTFAVLNYSLNFVLYFVSGSSFRREFYNTLQLRHMATTTPRRTSMRPPSAHYPRRRSLSDSVITTRCSMPHSIDVSKRVRRFSSAEIPINFSEWDYFSEWSSAYYYADSAIRFWSYFVAIMPFCLNTFLVNENIYIYICLCTCVPLLHNGIQYIYRQAYVLYCRAE